MINLAASRFRLRLHMGGRCRLWLSVAAGIAAVAAGVAYASSRGSEQPRVAARVLPLATGVFHTAVYLDCSKINSVAYDPHNPCQTFMLVKSNQSVSQLALLSAELWRYVRQAGSTPASQY